MVAIGKVYNDGYRLDVLSGLELSSYFSRSIFCPFPHIAPAECSNLAKLASLPVLNVVVFISFSFYDRPLWH